MKTPERRPLPNYGDLIPLAKFVEQVRDRAFVDHDGMGCWATATEAEWGGPDTWVWPSQLSKGKKPPKWATHVLWFNK